MCGGGSRHRPSPPGPASAGRASRPCASPRPSGCVACSPNRSRLAGCAAPCGPPARGLGHPSPQCVGGPRRASPAARGPVHPRSGASRFVAVRSMLAARVPLPVPPGLRAARIAPVASRRRPHMRPGFSPSRIARGFRCAPLAQASGHAASIRLLAALAPFRAAWLGHCLPPGACCAALRCPSRGLPPRPHPFGGVLASRCPRCPISPGGSPGPSRGRGPVSPPPPGMPSCGHCPEIVQETATGCGSLRQRRSTAAALPHGQPLPKSAAESQPRRNP